MLNGAKNVTAQADDVRQLTETEVCSVSGATKFHYITTPAGTVFAIGVDRNGKRIVERVN